MFKSDFGHELRLMLKIVSPAIHADFYDKYYSEYRQGLSGADFLQYLDESGVDVGGFFEQLSALEVELNSED